VSYRNEMLKRSAVSLFRGAVDAYMPNFTEDHGIIDWTSFAEFNLNPQEHNLTVPQQNHIDKVLKLVNGYLGDELSERDAVAEATTMSVRIAGWNEALDNGERTAPGDSNDNIFNLFFGNTNLSKEIRNGNHDAIETWNRGVSIVSSLYTKYLRMLLDDEEIPLQYIPVDQRDIDGAPLQVDWSDLAPHERLATMLTVLELRRSYIEDGTTHLEVGFREWIDVGLDNFTPELLNSETPDVGKISSVEGVLSFLNYLKGSSGSSRNADDIREATGMSDRAWDTIQLILGSGILESFTKPGIAAQLQPPPENLSPDALVEYQNNLRGIFMELRNAFTDTERMLATLLQNVRSSSTSLSINTLTEKQDTALRYLSQANSFKELETQASENPNSSDGTKLTYRLRIRKMLEDGGWIIPEDKKEARIALENLLPGEGEGKYVGIYEEIRDEDTKEAYMAGVYHRLGFLASFQRTEEGSVPIRNQVEIMISLPKMSQTSNYSLMEFGTMFNHIPGISTGSSRIPMLVGGEEIRLSKGNAHAINTIGGPRSDDDLEDYGNSIDAIANGRSFLQTPVMGLIEGERPWAGGRMGGRYFTGPRNEFDRLERIILASIDTGHDEIQRLTSSGASIQSLVSQVVSDYKIFFEQREELIRLTEKDFQSNVEYMLETNPAFSNNPNQASQTLRKDIEMLKNSRIELKDIIYEVLYRLSESSEESFSLFDRASFYRSPFLSSLNADIPIRYFGIYGRSEDDSLDRFPSLIRHSGGGRQGSPLDLKFHLDPNSPPVSLPFIRVFLDTSPHGGGSEWERGSESPGSRFESAIQQGLYLQADIGAQ
jgi:hypothetical protein